MKHYSVSFNKKSRLIKHPETVQPRAEGLHPLQPEHLQARLNDLLQIQNDFFPCFDWTFPPPLFAQSSGPQSITELFAQPSVIPNRYSVYLHIPFCKTLCSFCYYTVLPGRGIEQSATYVDYLLREMAMYHAPLTGQRCESIYLGGGTPTTLDNEHLTRLFNGLHQHFNLTDDAEITIEAAPGTLPRDKIELLKKLGVTRLSYGIQTLDEQMLATMNRYYSVDEALRELRDAVEIIGNVNVDTMYGFENEPEDALQNTLQKFTELGVPCLSIYSLDKQRSVKGKEDFGPPKDEMYLRKIALFQHAKELLAAAGFEPVLQNIFARPGAASYRHQVRRWDNLPQVALGVGSMGYAPRRPYQNYSTLKFYYEHIEAGRLPIMTMDCLSPEMELAREITSQLRFTEVNIDVIKQKYGVALDEVFGDLIDALLALGYLERIGPRLRMTARASYYNNVIPMLFAPDAFKESLLSLPEEYLEKFPVPYVMTQVGCTQSGPIEVNLGAA